MGTPLSTGFSVKSPVAIDDRLVLSREEMCEMNDDIMPEVYYALCKDDHIMYVYDKNNEYIAYDDGGYGKYRPSQTETDDMDITLVLPQIGDIPEGTKVIYAHTIEGKDYTVGDVYLGLANGYCICLSENLRFVGLDDMITKKLGISMDDESAIFNGYVNVAQHTVYITRINAEYDTPDAFLDAVTSIIEDKLGDGFAVGFDLDPLGNDMREFGRQVHF